MNSNWLFGYNIHILLFGKVHFNLARYACIYYSTKGSIHTITCSSCSCASFFLAHCHSPVIPVGFWLNHNSVFSLPPTFSSVWNLCFCLSIFTWGYYIFSRTMECPLHADHYCIPLQLHVSFRLFCILRYFAGRGFIPSLDFGDVDPLSCLPVKRVAGKCNPWLHFTPQQGLALGDRSGKRFTLDRVRTRGHTWSVLHPGGPPHPGSP